MAPPCLLHVVFQLLVFTYMAKGWKVRMTSWDVDRRSLPPQPPTLTLAPTVAGKERLRSCDNMPTGVVLVRTLDFLLVGGQDTFLAQWGKATTIAVHPTLGGSV